LPGPVRAGTLWPTAPLVRMEDSPSPVYGAALLMRFGGNTIRGSNPRSSANDQALRPAGEVPGFMSVIIYGSVWHTLGTTGDKRSDRDRRSLGQFLGDFNVNVGGKGRRGVP
jgi:hypothetical protein